MDARHLCSQETCSKKPGRAQRDRHEHEHGHEVLQRHNKEDVDGIDATALWTEAWVGYDGRFERGSKDVVNNDCSVHDDAKYSRG